MSAQITSDTQLAANSNELSIKETALDYIEGWYEGDSERMERSLHSDLAKRMVDLDPRLNRSRLNQMSALGLVRATKQAGANRSPIDNPQKDVTILDIFENAASVKIVANDWIDYLHLAKFNDKWLIVNVLWELKPKGK